MCASPLRLLQIHWGFLVGGGGRYAHILDRLSRFGPIHSHNLCILAPQWPVDTATLACLDHQSIRIAGRLDFTWIERVSRIVASLQPELIMSHGFNAHFVVWACQRRLGRRLPAVCSYHGPYHAAQFIKAIPGMIYDRFTEHFFSHHALGVVAVANHARRRLIKNGVPGRRIAVIHNGIPADIPVVPGVRRQVRDRWRLADNELLIGTVGRLESVKGLKDLIAAMRKVLSHSPNARLVIIGEGSQRQTLEHQIARLGLQEHVQLPGALSAAADVLPAFDVFVLPSLAECHSIALLEAMRAGLPIVATRIEGNSESISDNREGLLVPAQDPSALAKAIVRLTVSPGLRDSLGGQAQRRFQREFTEETMLRRTADWLLSMPAATGGKMYSDMRTPTAGARQHA